MPLSYCSVKVDSQGLELASHGTLAFPAAIYYNDLAYESVPWHWHDELEAVIVTEGTAVVLAGTERYLVKKGEAFFTNAGVFHADYCADDHVNDNTDDNEKNDSCRIHSIVFHPILVGGSFESLFWQDYLRPLLNNKSLQGIHLREDIPWQKKAIEAIERAWQSCANEVSGYPFLVRNDLSELIFLICENYYKMSDGSQMPPDARYQRDSERMKKMMQFITANYQEQITLEQIAGSAAVSKSECLRCFRNIIHVTPIQYLKDYRLSQASELLKASGMRITEAARQCGFLEMSYFSKEFRKKYGCSPVEFRKR